MEKIKQINIMQKNKTNKDNAKNKLNITIIYISIS
jgi:hypothetical protein